MKLKQWIVAAALLAAPATTFAETYSVWPVSGENRVPVEINYWWNVKIEDVKDGETYLYTRVSPNDPSSSNAASGGWLTVENAGFDFSKLAPLDLVFDAKVEGQGQWNVRLTAADGVESDVTLSVPADGEFHKVRINVQKEYPRVYTKWLSGDANNKGVFTFALSGSDLSADAAIMFKDCHYADAVQMPAVTIEATDVTATSAKLVYSANFPEGYTNTSVTINGRAAEGTEMLLSDLTPKTEYTYTIVAKGDFNGETYEASETVTFKTQRQAGDLPVWYGLTDKDGFSAEYSITYNPDKTLTVDALFETEKETPAADRNFHIFVGGDEWLKVRDDDGDGRHTGTTTKTYEEGTTITWEWYLPYAGGVYQEANQYVVGSENEAPLSIRVKAQAQNITFNSAEIAYDVTCPTNDFKVYYKAANGEATLATASPIALTGLAESTEYTYEVWAVAGELESKHATVTFKTPAENAVAKVYSDIFETEFKNAFLVGEDASARRTITASLPWSVTYTVEGTAIYAIDLSTVSNIVGLNPQIWSGNFKQLVKNESTGLYEYNFGAQEEGVEVAISHYLPYDGGVVDVRTPYTKWGMEKEEPHNIAVEALAQNVTFNSAEIAYTVTTTEADYKVYYKAAEGEALVADANPIALTGLAERTEYTYEVWAVAGDIESAHVTVSFKTTSENAVDKVYSDLFPVEFKNAYLVGEDESMRRSMFVTLPWTVTYTAQGTAKYAVDLSAVSNIVGLVPQIYWNGFKTLTKNDATGLYEYDFGAQEDGAETAISHYFAYAGSVVDSRSPYTNWGMEKEAPVLGEATGLTLTASKTAVLVGEKVILTAVAKDANGYYLPADEVEMTSNYGSDELNGVLYTPLEGKGERIITATSGEFTATVAVNVIASPEAKNLAHNLVGVTDNENVSGGAIENVTDDNRESQLEWNCNEHANHYFILDLGDHYYIEAVEVFFEGAYSTKFTVTLSADAPTELGAAAAAAPMAVATENVVFENTKNDIQHYFTHDPADQHRYVALRTSEALNNGWGIKLRDMKVYGTQAAPTVTGVENIATDNTDDNDAPVEFYNLNGVRVNNPAAGLYIRRQGNTVTKVLVK